MGRKPRSKNKSKAEKPAAKAKPGRKPFKAPVSTKGGKPAPETTRAEAITARVTPAGTLKSLLSTCRGYKQNVDGIVSKMREEIGFAVSKKHLNKEAFAFLRKMDRMEAEKASEFWHTIVRYMELTGIMAKIEAVGRLPLEDGDGDADPIDQDFTEVDDGPTEDDPAGMRAAEVAANGGNGHAMPPHPGIDPAPSEPENVTRPRFGGRNKPGISGDELAKATGIEPSAAKH